jgi:hypothetical protein
MKDQKGGTGTAPPIQNLGSRWWVVNDTPQLLYPDDDTHCIGDWVSLKAVANLAPAGAWNRACPACSNSLY